MRGSGAGRCIAFALLMQVLPACQNTALRQERERLSALEARVDRVEGQLFGPRIIVAGILGLAGAALGCVGLWRKHRNLQVLGAGLGVLAAAIGFFGEDIVDLLG